MGMLTIGAFAKACRLSPKALRLYDELDLLRPARVDAQPPQPRHEPGLFQLGSRVVPVSGVRVDAGASPKVKVKRGVPVPRGGC
jgi:hypothetical protein